MHWDQKIVNKIKGKFIICKEAVTWCDSLHPNVVVKLVIHPISIGEDKTGDRDNLINDFRESQRPGTKSVWLTKRGSFISDCLWDGTKRKINVCDKGLWRYRVCPFATGVVNGKPEKEFRVTVFSLGGLASNQTGDKGGKPSRHPLHPEPLQFTRTSTLGCHILRRPSLDSLTTLKTRTISTQEPSFIT